MDNNTLRIKKLVSVLNEASKAYYQDDKELMSNLEYDGLYDELVALEKETGILLTNSPTRKVGYEILSELPKERHIEPMLSLNKTKVVADLESWLGSEEGVLSWKLDGLTIVLTYEDGQLVKGVTRGNGEVGEVITNNVKVFENVPLTIPVLSRVVVRGEAVIKYSDFNRINEGLDDDHKYKNPRNLCSGSVRQLNSEIAASRNINFFAFQMVQIEEMDFETRIEQLDYLKSLGFVVVESVAVNQENIGQEVLAFKEKISSNDFASDGLVLTFNSIEYASKLGKTSKFPKHSIAFKWQDEIATTKLVDMEWSPSRTGLINPVAIFEAVDLEGTTVTRASVHNISIVKALELGLGDEIQVYKANMIIPQIAENNTRSNSLEIPQQCPVCGEKTEIQQLNDVQTLYCNNVKCPAKMIKSFGHFASRDAMNIEGLSEATIEKFVENKYLSRLSDLFAIEQYKEEIVALEGFGQKSYENLVRSINKSVNVNIANFIYALGILNIGLSNAKLLCKYFQYDIEKVLEAKYEDLIDVEGFGEIIARQLVAYFEDEENRSEINRLLKYIDLQVPEVSEVEQSLEGKVFVITGSLTEFENRKALKAYIEDLGGKVTGSVTSKTDYLINNNVASGSSKNKKAKELDVPIIREVDFINMVNENEG